LHALLSAETTSRPPLLVIDDVSRRFGLRTVVSHVTLAIDAGEIHLIVGPNGSGKSTLARLGVGLLRPHQGAVRLSGRDPRTDPPIRSAIGFSGHESLLYDDLSPLDNLTFAARLHGLRGPAAVAHAALDRWHIGAERSVPVRKLSRGFVQRVALARSLVHTPALVVWDEPLTGLDSVTVERAVAVAAEERQRGAALVVISHVLPDLWRVHSHAHVIRAGEVALSTDSPGELAEFSQRYAELIG
jgi:ABC-type multidrug transport system ATPase subunit